MPTYEYSCSTCDTTHEVQQKMTDATLTDCPVCGTSGVRKLFSGVGIHFKGSGFYRTDSRDAKSTKSAADSGSSSSGTSSGASSGGSSSGTSTGGSPGGSSSGTSSSGTSSSGTSSSGSSSSGSSSAAPAKSTASS